MDLPTSRELELETLLRQRDAQVSELSDEVTRLRQYLSTQPGPSTSDPVTLPPTLVSILLPHLSNAPSSDGGTTSGSSTVTAALTQRTRLLQEENDELYDLLKLGETGRLKEEVRGLRRVVERLESALRESHQVIVSLSTELDKSYETFMSSARPANSVKSYSRSPRNSYHPTVHATPAGNGNGASKLPPTGPRAHKKPRLSEPQTSPPQRPNASLPFSKSSQNQSNPSRVNDAREQSPRQSLDGRAKPNHVKMEVDGDPRERPRSPVERDRERDRNRDRERLPRERERDRDRDRDGNRLSRRNGNFWGGGPGRGASAGGGRRVDRGMASGNSYGSGDRTLAERMGL